MTEQPSEEQIKALQEKIKNMSPEELKEFQKKQCIFCQIIEGKVQSKIIYEDEKTKAILDINPANPGHILLMPKEHYTIMPQMPADEISHIFVVAKALSNALLKGIGAQGTNILIANGVAAGQRAQHFMIHIIPRMDKDGIKFELPQNTIPEEELEKIQHKLAKTLGMPEKEEEEKAPLPLKMPDKDEVEEEPDDETAEEDVPRKDNLEEDEDHEEEPEDKESNKTKEEVDLDDIANLLGGK